jgi:hypothetical protein
MRIFFDREAPLFYTSGDESFAGIEVTVDEDLANFLVRLNQLVEDTRLSFLTVGAPEDFNQQLSDTFIEGIKTITEELENG